MKKFFFSVREIDALFGSNKNLEYKIGKKKIEYEIVSRELFKDVEGD